MFREIKLGQQVFSGLIGWSPGSTVGGVLSPLWRKRPGHYQLSPKVWDYRVAPLDNQ
jgi:hypothetical protein